MTSRGRFAAAPATSWASWVKVWEIGLTAPVVIGMRLTRLMVAGPASTRRGRREVNRMGWEKFEAVGDQLLGTAVLLGGLNVEMAGLVMGAVRAGAAWPVAALTRSLAAVPAAVSAAMVDPVHSRVRANRGRLVGW